MAKSVNILIAAKDHASSAFAKAGAAAGGFGSRIMSLKGLLAGALGGLAVGASIQKALAAYGEAEQAQARLAGTLRATGGAIGLTQDQLNAFASELQRTTTFEDDAVTAGQATLAMFKSFSGDTFNRATKAMVDLTAAMGGDDLQAAAMRIGKALADPVRGLNQLARAGITFTAEQKAQVDALTATGQTAAAQDIILKCLESTVGGVSEAMAQTSTGAMAQFKNAVGDVWEAIGQALAPTLKGLVGHLQDLLPYLHTAAEWLGEHLTMAFHVAEWAGQNWQQSLELALVAGQLGILSFYEDVKYFFTDAIPTYLGWFGRNWKEIFIDALNAVGYAFENFGRNVWTIMGEVWEYITTWGSSGFEEGWTNNLRGLLDGFTSVLQEEFPTVAERGLTATELALSQRMDELSAHLSGTLADALAPKTSPYVTPALTLPGQPGLAAATAATTASKSTLAATEARFLGRSPADDAARRAADETRRNTATMVKLLTRHIDLAERQLRATEEQTQAASKEEEVDI